MGAYRQEVALPTTLTDLLEARDKCIMLWDQADQLCQAAADTMKPHGNYLVPHEANLGIKGERRTQALDQRLWARAMDLTGFRQLMDTKALGDFQRQVERDCPAFTIDTVRATFLELIQSRDEMFNRGLVNTFQDLSPSYRTNAREPFRIGSKIICEGMTTAWYGSLTVADGTYARAGSRVNDLDRIFRTLDGEKFTPRELEQAINAEWKLCHDAGRGYVFSNEYFRIKGFKKGTMHIEIKRADLLERANDIVAAWYGENVLADGRAA